MKFFLVALLASLWLTDVTAAPSNPDFSLQENELYGEFDDRLRGYWVNFRCISDVITKVVVGTDFETHWEKTRTDIRRIIDVEWKKCTELDDLGKQVKCKTTLVRKVVDLFLTFNDKLVEAKKWDLVRKIKETVVTKCLWKKDNIFEFNADVEQFDASLPVKFECLVDVLVKVSKLHNLETLWKRSQPQLEQHITKWKQCHTAGNVLLVFLCNIREGAASFSIVNEYITLANTKDPKFVHDFLEHYKKTCVGVSYDIDIDDLDEMFAVEGIDECIRKITLRINCIIDAITGGIKDTDFRKDWEKYKKDLEKLLVRLKTCKNESSTTDAAKCIKNELKYAHEIFSKFFDSLKKNNIIAFNKIKEYIRKRCYA